MKVYRIWCEWDMPIAQGTFSSREKAQAAIDTENWESLTDYSRDEVIEDEMVSIEELEVG